MSGRRTHRSQNYIWGTGLLRLDRVARKSLVASRSFYKIAEP